MVYFGLNSGLFLAQDELSKLAPTEELYGALAGAVNADGLKMSLIRSMKSPTDGVTAVRHMEQPAGGLVSLLERWNDMRAEGDEASS